MKLHILHIYVSLLFTVSTTLALPSFTNSLLQVAHDYISENTLPTLLETAQSIGNEATKFAETMKEELLKDSLPLEKISQLKQEILDLMDTTKAHIGDLENLNINFTEFYQMLSLEIYQGTERLKEEIQMPSTEDNGRCRHKRREAIVKALDMIENALVLVSGIWDEREDVIREKFSHVRPHILQVGLTAGNLVDDHLDIVEVAIVPLFSMILPEFLPLGLIALVLGFGPHSPLLVKTFTAYDYISAKAASIEPPEFDFWKKVQDIGNKATEYAERTMQAEFIKYNVPLEKIEELKQGMQGLVDTGTKVFQIPMSLAARNLNNNVDEFYQMLSTEIDLVIERLKDEFQEPLPEDRIENGKKREEVVVKALDMIEDALVSVYGHWNVPEDEVREKFSHVRPHIFHVVVVAGNLAEKYPCVTEIVLFSLVVMMWPPGLMPLRLIARVFGIGPLGLIKGSLAAWSQRYFFGGVIEEGSWFAMLQRAGMEHNSSRFWRYFYKAISSAFIWIFFVADREQTSGSRLSTFS